MTESKRAKRPNGASSVYKGADGRWHGRVTIGLLDNGEPDRRHIKRKSQAEVIARVRELERLRDQGVTPRKGQAWTVAKWLTHWVENIASAVVRESSLSAYRVAVNVHLIPGLGGQRLDRLEPEHLERLYARMMAAGSAPATAHQVHRTVRTALGEAVRRGHLHRNVATLAKPPRLRPPDVDPYSVEDVQRLLTTASKGRNGVRWAIALALGLRQGEALGLKWTDVDLDTGSLRVARSRQRPKWAHGCGGGCERAYAGHCPERVPLRAETADTKSSAGRRVLGLPDELVSLLRAHRVVQQQERETAAELWEEGGWVFTTPTGQPLNPRTDYTNWKRLLDQAGLRDGRLHDARHTAATVLLLLGVTERAVMGVMGWSNTAMAARYQHLTAPVRRDIAARIGGLIWSPTEPS